MYIQHSNFANDKWDEKENKETTPITIVTYNINYIEITKKVKDLHDYNFKSLKKEIKEDFKKCRDLPGSWICSISIEKWLSYQKQSIHSMQSPSKFQQNSSKTWKEQSEVEKTQNTKNN